MIYCENIVKILCTWQLFFYSFTDFIIFFSIFGNGMVTIAKTIFFDKTNFFFHFRQCHCHNYKKKKKIIYFPILAMASPQLLFFSTQDTGPGRNLGIGISVTALPKFLFFLSPTFSFSLSYFCWISVILLPKFFLFPQFAN